MKKIILVILISFSSFSVLKADFLAPLIRVSYDFNLGYTTSIGISWNNTTSGDIGAGAYFLYSFSHKKGRENVEGKNFSTGLYAGLGIASFRVGVNRMLIKTTRDTKSSLVKNLKVNEPGTYWGIEASSQMFLLNGCAGIIFPSNFSNPIKPKLNLSAGLGIF